MIKTMILITTLIIFVYIGGCVGGQSMEDRAADPTIPKMAVDKTCVVLLGETLGTYNNDGMNPTSKILLRNDCGDIVEGTAIYTGYNARGEPATQLVSHFGQQFSIATSEMKYVTVRLPVEWFGKGTCTGCVASYDITIVVDKIGIDQRRTVVSKYSNQSLATTTGIAGDVLKQCNNWECT
jgi:hypothetical protein